LAVTLQPCLLDAECQPIAVAVLMLSPQCHRIAERVALGDGGGNALPESVPRFLLGPIRGW